MDPDAQPGPWRPPRRWPVPVLSVLLVLAIVLAGYATVLARSWWEQAETLEARAVDLGAELGTTAAELEQVRGDLLVAEGQLATARDRIVALADEKAQAGDARESQRLVAEYQGRISRAAASVASSLEQCVRGQEQLITYLESADVYDPASLAEYRSQVETFCADAVAANANLQDELAG